MQNSENNHQWLDQNGWELKKTYVQTRNGKIAEVTLNIAKARDGRKILYALSNIKEVDNGNVPSTLKKEGPARNVNFNDSITQPSNGVKKNLFNGNSGGLSGIDAFRLGQALIGAENAGDVSSDVSVPGAELATRYISTQEAMKLLEKSGVKITEAQAESLKKHHNQRAELARAIARVFGVNVRFGGVEPGAMAQYEKSTNTIYLNPSEKVSVMRKLAEGHEIVHALEQTPNYDKISKLVIENVFGGLNSNAYIAEASRIDALYKRMGTNLTPKELQEEVVAEYFRTKVFKDAKTLTDFIIENHETLGKEFFLNLKGISDKVKQVFNEKILGKTGDVPEVPLSDRILTEFATAMNQHRRDRNREIVSQRLDAVAEGYGLLDRNGSTENGRQSLILENSKGKYVQADPSRQIIKSNSVKKWRKDVEDYINENIRQGKDVQFFDENGDALTITEVTAGKAGFRNETGKGILSTGMYRAKINAAGHIDELSQTSRITTPHKNDTKNHAIAKDGFEYREAFFQDYDGEYYRVEFSVGKNGEIKTVYDVEPLKKTSFPILAQRPRGSKATETKSMNALYHSNKYLSSRKFLRQSLEARLSSDDTLDAMDTIDEIVSKGGTVDERGYVTLYHATSEENAINVRKSKQMHAKEDGIFFSTKPDGEIKSYGGTLLKFQVPVEALEMNDIFDSEIHFRIPLENKNSVLDVSKYLVSQRKQNNRKSLATESSVREFEEASKLKSFPEDATDENGRQNMVAGKALKNNDATLTGNAESGTIKLNNTIFDEEVPFKKWKPDLKKSQLKYLAQIIRRDVETSTNAITDKANYIVTRIDGMKVFAIYSTEFALDPTLLYESKEEQATFETKVLKIILEDYENGRSNDTQSEVVDPIFSSDWMRKMGSLRDSAGTLERDRGAGDVTVLQGKSSPKPSTAFRNVIKNLFEVQGAEQRKSLTSKRYLVTESSVREFEEARNNLIPDEAFAEQARLEAEEFLEAPDITTYEDVAKRYQHERDLFDGALKDVKIERLSNTEYLKAVSGDIVKAHEIFKNVRRRADNIIIQLGDDYGRIEQREVERLLSGDLEVSEISSRANKDVVLKAYGMLKHASDMEHTLWDIRRASKSRYTEFGKTKSNRLFCCF